MKGTWLFDGTLIPMAGGYVPVNDIKTGDVLYSEFGNPVPVVSKEVDIQILCKLTSPRVVDGRLSNSNNTITIGTNSLLMMKTYRRKNYSELSISEIAESGILESDGSDIIMKWSAKHGQSMITPYVQPVGNIDYQVVLNMFSHPDFIIPNCYAYGSKMQKMQALDVLEHYIKQLGGYQDEYYHLQLSDVVLKRQLSFMIESLGCSVWFDGLSIVWDRSVVCTDTYFSDIDKLGYSKRVYAICTDGHIPYQAGPFHTVVSSL